MNESNASWYAVMTGPKMEAKADLELRRKAFRTFYPFSRIRVRRKRPGTTMRVALWIEKPYFNRYIFVCVPPGRSVYEVNNTDGVATVVYLGEKPLAIPDDVMDEIMDHADGQGMMEEINDVDPPRPLARPRLAPGTKVSLKENSPFEGLIAQVSVDTGRAVRLWLNVLGAEREVAVSPSMVAEITT